MHDAPPTDAACTSGRAWRGVQSLLHAAAGAAAGTWIAAQAGAADGAQLAAAAVAAAAGGWFGARAGDAAEAAASLRWDGSGWSLEAAGSAQTGRAKPVFDFAGALLVAFAPDGGGRRRWLAFGAAASGPLRAALHATPHRAPPAAPRTD